MSKPASKTVIGIFVVGAIALVVIAIVILGSGKFFKRTFTVVCFFQGSVGGLNEGSPVVFRGVKIGSVKDIVLRADSEKLTFTIPVYIEIEPAKFTVTGPRPKQLGQNLKTFIDRGLRATLETQSIVTGQMQVSLDFYPEKPAKFVGLDAETPEIPTIRTAMQELTEKVEKIPIDEIFAKILSAVQGIEKVNFSESARKTISFTEPIFTPLNTTGEPSFSPPTDPLKKQTAVKVRLKNFPEPRITIAITTNAIAPTTNIPMTVLLAGLLIEPP